jgi:hypothetical protein
MDHFRYINKEISVLDGINLGATVNAETRIPNTWSLLQTTESFVQFTMIGWMIGILKPRRLSHIHIFL